MTVIDHIQEVVVTHIRQTDNDIRYQSYLRLKI